MKDLCLYVLFNGPPLSTEQKTNFRKSYYKQHQGNKVITLMFSKNIVETHPTLLRLQYV